jgi:type IV pilus assembly protein PilM
VASRSAIGLDIGTSAVRAAEVSMGKRPPTFERFGQVALAPGLVRAGEVIDPEAVAVAIKQLWSGTRFSSKRVILGVANQKVVVRQVDLPWMPEAELRESLGFHVQEFIPMPVEEALLDFHPLEETVDANGTRTLRVLLVAAMRSMVETHIQAAKLAGLRVEGVDLTSFAVLRALTADQDVAMAGAAEVLVDIGASVTNIVVHAEGVPRFVRILLMGGDDVTEAVADRVGLAHDAAESMKVELGLTSAGFETPEGHPASQAIGSTAAQLVEEVRGSIDYYLAQPNVERLGRVVLSGGGGRLTGLDAWLSAATRLPVERAEPLSGFRVGRVGLSPDQLEQVRALTAVPVGLAMGAA